jgi:hypothetical protein
MFQNENYWVDLDEIWYEQYAIRGHPQLLCLTLTMVTMIIYNSTNHSDYIHSFHSLIYYSNQNSNSSELWSFSKCSYIPTQFFWKVICSLYFIQTALLLKVSVVYIL